MYKFCPDKKFQIFLYVFLTPPSLQVPEAQFNMRQTYSLSSLAFKRVTCGRAITKHVSPPPCYPRYMKVQLGAWSKQNISRQHLPQSKYIYVPSMFSCLCSYEIEIDINTMLCFLSK